MVLKKQNLSNYLLFFLNKKSSNITEILSVKKKILYVVIPYIGHLSVKIKIETSKLKSEYSPHLYYQLILVDNSKLNLF